MDRFRNGDIILEARTAEEWKRADANKWPAWCYYDNDPANGSIYGKLYNWYAVNDPRGLAPEGWHVPTDAEWTKLSDGLGGSTFAGGKMKSSSGWDANGNGTNTSRFSGRPGGYRVSSGTFNFRGAGGDWWTATAPTTGVAWDRYLEHSDDEMYRYFKAKGCGFSVRCVRN